VLKEECQNACFAKVLRSKAEVCKTSTPSSNLGAAFFIVGSPVSEVFKGDRTFQQSEIQ